MENWKNKFVIFFVLLLIVVFGILVFCALDRGTTTVEDVLEPKTVLSFE